MTFFTEVITQHFLQITYILLAFVILQTLILFFLCFSAICEFQCRFYKNIYYGNVLLHFGLKEAKIHKIFKKCFSSTHLKQISIQNYPFMQLC